MAPVHRLWSSSRSGRCDYDLDGHQSVINHT
jgi:hypothetical protein